MANDWPVALCKPFKKPEGKGETYLCYHLPGLLLNSGSPVEYLHNTPWRLCRRVQTFKQTLSWGCGTAAEADNCFSRDVVTDISQVATGLISRRSNIYNHFALLLSVF